MNKSYVWRIGMAACLTLTGCTDKQVSPAQPCNAGVCKVSIVITDCTQASGFKVRPDPLTVSGPNNIEWTITGDYKFTDDGIVIPTGGSVFDGKEKQSDKKFKWHDKHNETTLPVDYKYTVNVVPTSGAASCIALDPVISNQ